MVGSAQIAIDCMLLFVVAWATYEDLARHKIPNTIVLAGLTAALVMNSAVHGWDGPLMVVSGAAIGLAALLPFYLLRGMGAGDVKLMAAVGAFVGPVGALYAAAATIIFGGAIGLAWMALRVIANAVAAGSAAPYALACWENTIATVRKERFPYAVAIAAGAGFTLWIRSEGTGVSSVIARWLA